MKQWKDHDDGDDQMLKLGKEEREKQKAQGKGVYCRSYFVLVIETLSECPVEVDQMRPIGKSRFWELTGNDRTLGLSVRSLVPERPVSQ